MSAAMDEHLDLCAALVAGNLDAVDRKRFAEHLADGCEECERIMPAYERATVLLAAALPLSAPSPAVRERVLEAAATLPPPAIMPMAMPPAVVLPLRRARPQRQLTFNPPAWFWGAVSGAAVLVAIIAITMASQFADQAKKLRAELASNTDMLTGINAQLQEAKAWDATLTSPESRAVVLVSTPRSETYLRAHATYDPRSQRAVFIFSDLRAARDKAYTLWAIDSGSYRSLGRIATDEQGRAVVRVEHAGDPNRLTDFAVSLENAATPPNAPTPAGLIVMVGHIGG